MKDEDIKNNPSKVWKFRNRMSQRKKLRYQCRLCTEFNKQKHATQKNNFKGIDR